MPQDMSNLEAALNMVREELERLIRGAREEGAEAYGRGDQATFQRADALRQSLEDFANRFEALCRDLPTATRRTRTRRQTAPPASPRARRGELVHEKEFLFPLLRALAESGGAAHREQVFVQLQRAMADRLGEADWRVQNTGEIRWRKRVAWLRNSLGKAGLVTRGEGRGVWAITGEGRQELAAGDLEATWKRVMEAKKGSRRG